MIKCTNDLCIYNTKKSECYLNKNKISAKGICLSFTSHKIFDELEELYKKDVENNKRANKCPVNNSSCDNDFCIYNKKMQCVLNKPLKTQYGYCGDFTSENYLDDIIDTYEKDLEKE